MSEYEIDDETPCPKCGHIPTHWRRCTNQGCEDGWINLFEEDPLNFSPDEEEICPECHNTGIEKWCPSCSYDLWLSALSSGKEENE